MLHPKFFLCTYLKFLFLLIPFSQGTDTLTLTLPISDELEGTLVSAGERFELGFFSPGTSENRYVGIWYWDDPHTVIWVANRERPVSNRSGVFCLNVEGNLGLSSMGGESYWSTKLKANASSDRTAKLMDSGNLVLSETSEDGVPETLRQSFDEPTDTFLPGMVMGENFSLISWKGSDEPALGDFTFQKDPEDSNRWIIQRKSSTFWESGVSGKFIPDGLPPAVSSLLKTSTLNDGQTENFTSNARLVMNFTGMIQYFTLSSGKKVRNLSWSEPKDPCHRFNYCGNFGICNPQNKPMCRCLWGFTPLQPDNWHQEKFSQGCMRTSSSSPCRPNNQTTFESLMVIQIGRRDQESESNSSAQCMEECLTDCSCQAYSYYHNQSAATGRCLIWTETLTNIQEGIENRHNVSVRVNLGSLLFSAKLKSLILYALLGSKALNTWFTSAAAVHKGKPHYIIYLVVVGIPVLIITVGSLLYVRSKLVSEQGIMISKLTVC